MALDRLGERMIQQVKTSFMYLIVLGIGAILLMFSMTVPIVSSDADFSIYNSRWNGCSELGRDVYETGSFVPTIDISGSSKERIAHQNLDLLEGEIDPRESSIIIIGPEVDFTEEEVNYLHGFLRQGGLVLLADDSGTGNGLLEGLNTSTRISTTPMYDLAFERNVNFTVTTEVSDHPITRDVSMLVMNIPASLSPSSRAYPVFNSSSTSWLDVVPNKERDEGEPRGPFPMMIVEPYGRGDLIVLSEPSLLINGMNGNSSKDNNIFVRNLIEFVTQGRNTTVIDEAHRDVTDPVTFTDQFVEVIDDTHEKVILLVVVSAMFIILNTSYPRRFFEGLRRVIDRFLSEDPGGNIDERDPLDVVMERHPDWDRKILDRIMKDIEGTQ